ncbi:hypothetical protein O181_008470 [Austropuccinia psidii MF-1]|uniref:Uncharacterized protein n=1 Tax=Austropuccinia psidii MF-1 TaxID=1389203 RepID=A0A9Q3BPE5_9BASI|nr:hypothetical protein [Austropuccinia psidii MF-1]
MLVNVSRQRDLARWTNVGGPIYCSAKVPISRTNNEGVVKRIRKLTDSQTNTNSKDSDELDGEEVQVVLPMAYQSSSISPSNLPSKKFQNQVIPITPRDFQPLFSTAPYSLPHSSPAL